MDKLASESIAKQNAAIGNLRGVLVSLFMFAFLISLFPSRSYDIWWHLANGREMVQGNFPTTNLYSFSTPSYPVTPTHWLFGFLSYAAYSVGGLGLLIIIKSLLVAGTFSLVALTSIKKKVGIRTCVAVVIVAILASRSRFIERPHILTMLGLAVFGYILERSRSKPKLIWSLPAILILWANLHAGCLFGVGLLGLHTIASIILTSMRYFKNKHADVGNKQDLDLGRTKLLIATSVLALLAVMITPAHIKVYTYNLWHVNLQSVIPLTEFRTSIPSEQPYFYLLLIGGAILLAIDYKNTRLESILVYLVFGVLGIYAVRSCANFAIVATPAIAFALSNVLRSRVEIKYRQQLPIGILSGLLSFSPFLMHAVGQHKIGGGIWPNFLPTGAAEFMQRELPNKRSFNDMAAGGYLAWKWYPEKQIFIDGRTNAYPRDLFRELYKRHLTQEGVDSVLNRFDISSAILMRYGSGNPFWPYFNLKRWAVVYCDEQSVVVLLRTIRNAKLIEKYEQMFGAESWAALSRWYAERQEVLPAASVANKALNTKNIKDAKQIATLYLRRAHGYRTLGKNELARADYKQATELRPNWAVAYENLGHTLFDLKIYDAAIGNIEIALSKGARRSPSVLITLARANTALGQTEVANRYWSQLLVHKDAHPAQIILASDALKNKEPR